MINSFRAGSGTTEIATQPDEECGYVCDVCTSPVRFDMATGSFFHELGPAYRALETIAREVRPVTGNENRR